MTLQERFLAAEAIEEPFRRNAAFARLQAEHDIGYLEKEVESARAALERAASTPNPAGYADRIESCLRDWRYKHARLEQAHCTMQLLNQLRDETN